VEDDYDPQHIEQHVYQLLLLVQHSLLELQTLYQSAHQFQQLNLIRVDENDFVNKSIEHHYHQ